MNVRRITLGLTAATAALGLSGAAAAVALGSGTAPAAVRPTASAAPIAQSGKWPYFACISYGNFGICVGPPTD